ETAEAFPRTRNDLSQRPSATPRDLVGEMPSGRCAPTEAKRIESKGLDLDVRIVLDEAIQSDLDLAKCAIHPRGDARLATPKPCPKKTVFPSRLSTDAFYINVQRRVLLLSGPFRAG